MWCYQKPGFEALLLTELQKQQQSSQFCDTVLKADGVSVPAHSCVLSAFSPQLSSSLAQASDLGHKRLLEFGSLGACTLLHLVRLLYSGEMVGEGEREKQQAVSAAAKLGIHGLVEVSHVDGEHRKVRDAHLYTDAECSVGVQTDSQILEENQVRLGGWRREIRDGETLLWRERLPTCGTEIWTQTEDLQPSGPYSSQPPVTYETIDLNVLQTLGETEPLQIPHVPMSVLCQNEDNHCYGQSSLSAAIPSQAVQYPSVQNNAFSSPSQTMVGAAETPYWGQGVGRAAEMVGLAEEGFEQFEGNIPGFINYFLNPEQEEGSNRRRGRKRQGAGVGGARQSGTRGRLRGRPRGQGGLTQTVQDVGVSKISKMYLHRWGMCTNRTGQGGGAVGRKLYVKTREFVRSGRSTQRRKNHGFEWDMNQCTTKLLKPAAVNRGQRGRPRTVANASRQALVSPPQRPHSITKRPPARGPGEQREQIDLLLEEVMMGLDILPNKRKSQAGSTAVAPVASRGRDVPSSEVPVLQQQNEGEIPDILDRFLQSFEWMESGTAQSSSESSEPHTNVKQYRKRNIQLSLHTPRGAACSTGKPARLTGTPGLPGASTQSETSGTDNPMEYSNCSQRHKSSGQSRPAVRRPRTTKNYLLSMVKPRARSKKSTVSDVLQKEQVKQQVTKQLQQTPVVKLERAGMLSENMNVQKLRQKQPRAKKMPSAKSQRITKIYPIRSRFKEAHITEAISFLEPLSNCTSKATKHGLVPFSSPPDISLSTAEELMENNEDEAESDTCQPERRGRKRAFDSLSPSQISSAVEVKRSCLDSEKSIFQTMDAEVIDVETISLNSTSNTELINNKGEADLVTEDCSTDTERESNDIIDVDGLDWDFDGTGLNREDLVDTEVVCSFKADIVTAAEPEVLDNYIDVIGDSSPNPDSDETENDTDVPETVVLSKGRLVRC